MRVGTSLLASCRLTSLIYFWQECINSVLKSLEEISLVLHYRPVFSFCIYRSIPVIWYHPEISKPQLQIPSITRPCTPPPHPRCPQSLSYLIISYSSQVFVPAIININRDIFLAHDSPRDESFLLPSWKRLCHMVMWAEPFTVSHPGPLPQFKEWMDDSSLALSESFLWFFFSN